MDNNDLHENSSDKTEYMIRSYIYKVIKFSRKQYDKLNRFILFHEELTFDSLDFEAICVDQYSEEVQDLSINSSLHYSFLENVFSDSKVFNVVKNLTLKQKQVIYMKFIKDMTDQEIADAMGISRQAVCKVKNAAIDKITKAFES